MTMTDERRCTYCKSWTSGHLPVCSDCHGERTDAMCRLQDAERRLAAVREVLDRCSASLDANPTAASLRDAIRAALETE